MLYLLLDFTYVGFVCLVVVWNWIWNGHCMLDLEIALEYECSMDIVVVMVASHLASRISLPVFPSSRLPVLSCLSCHLITTSAPFPNFSEFRHRLCLTQRLVFWIFFLPLVEFKEGRSARAQR
jgi:hypothetical protein